MEAEVYVDGLRDCVSGPRWPYTESCHLYTLPGWEEDLHAFAQRIGLRRSWYQNGTMPHYDLTAAKRRQAVAMGAQEVTDKQLVEHIRLWRRTNGHAKKIIISEQIKEARVAAPKAEGGHP